MLQVEINKREIGSRYRKNGKAIEERLMAAPQKEREAWSEALAKGDNISLLVDGLGKLDIGKDTLTVEKRKRTEYGMFSQNVTKLTSRTAN